MLIQRLHDLHANETGAEEGMNKLLIFAIVALPLLALLIFFGKNIADFADEQWAEVFDGKKGDIDIK
jgi:hypothetical protein